MDKDKEEQSFTVGGWVSYDGKFHGIKPSWWRKLLAKIQLRLSGWKFRLVGYDEFRRVVDDPWESPKGDEQNSEGH